jgi:hypothetical protein
VRRYALIVGVLLAGCNGREQVALKYTLGFEPAQVARVETVVSVDPKDPRKFFADQPYRSVSLGVGYEVVDNPELGTRVMKVTQEAALGFKFDKNFIFTLLPPADGEAPPLTIRARAVGTTKNTLGETAPLPVSFGPGTELVVQIDDQRCGSEACAADEACCNKKCLRTDNDPFNCGACGQTCGTSESCSGGACRCAGGSGCTGGLACCGDGCFDLKTDRANCGTCGKTCNTGEQCVNGACTCDGGAACGTNGLCCPGTGCSGSGTCPCGATTCGPTQICCGGNTCKNFLSDDANCGSCGNVCPMGLHCAGGSCRCNGQVCSGGDTCCTGGCANTANDVNNCGSCGKKCQMGETCQTGRCRCGNGTMACAMDQICCGSACKSHLVDPNNCGGCNATCGTGETCMGGNCKCQGGAPCVGTQICCPPKTGLPGGCFDKLNDPQHCGDCDTRCNTGESCVAGVCTLTSCPIVCLNGNECVGNQCLCNGGPGCTGTTNCCPAGCVELSSDINNCGVCGNKCKAREYCCGGSCREPSDLDCGGCGIMCGGLQYCCTCGNPPKCVGLHELCLCTDGPGEPGPK